jgi:hypothetical protein
LGPNWACNNKWPETELQYEVDPYDTDIYLVVQGKKNQTRIKKYTTFALRNMLAVAG